MKKLVCLSLVCIFLLSINHIASAQGITNTWYFGLNAGVDFNTGTLVALTDGQLSTLEGCATISDSNGNLLFYTDGVHAWDQSHNLMPNGSGLLGHGNSTQSALIVPNPSVSNIYYLFTVGIAGGVMAYSEVDMNLNGGLGDITTTKNIIMLNNAIERITAVKADNGDYWVITKIHGGDFHSFRVSGAGVATTGVTSNVGHSIGASNGEGAIKASPNSKKVAVTYFHEDIELFDFDNATGQLSYQLTIPHTGVYAPYGIEFSQNSKVLYYTELGNNAISQIDLLAGSNTAIINSKTDIGFNPMLNYGALQLAMDGKIYASNHNDSALSVIHTPNKLGTACNFQGSAVSLNGRIAQIGLPNFIPSFFENPFSVQYFCLGDSTCFNYDTINIDSVTWNFDDLNSGIANHATSFAPKHVFSDTGLYEVVLTVYRGGIETTLNQLVRIFPSVAINLGQDTTLCDTANLLLSMPQNGLDYTWQDGSTSNTFLVHQTGVYAITATNGNCEDTDSIVITFNPCFVDSFSVQGFCFGALTSFHYSDTNVDSIRWDFDDLGTGILNTSTQHSAQHRFSGPGTFDVSLTVYRNGFSTTTRQHVLIYPAVVLDLGEDTTLCNDETLFLNTPEPNTNYVWQDGSTNATFLVHQSGSYSVTATTANCQSTDSVEVTFVDCNACVVAIPDAFSPNEDGRNDVFKGVYKSNCLITNYRLSVYNRWGQEIYRTNNKDEGWNGMYNGVLQPQEVYVYIMDYEIRGTSKTQRSRGRFTLLR